MAFAERGECLELRALGARQMRLVRLMPIDQQADASNPAQRHKTCPDLLGGLWIDRPDQVWCADITYRPTRQGFHYPMAIMDWFTHKVPALRISNTREADFCVGALNEGIHKFGAPRIMNADQGSQVTSFDRTGRLEQARTRISMEGKACYFDNIFIWRLWQSMKYDCVYVHAWETGSQVRAGVGRWITFCNHLHVHAAMADNSPPWSPSTLLKPMSRCRL